MSYKISQALEEIKKNYDSTIQIIDGLHFKQKDIIRIVEFGSNSRYLNGRVDELGREKPYYNIRNAVCDVENAAKDINTGDITATSDDGEHYTESFLMTKDIYEWMKESNFAKTLNDMRDTHTAYGSLLVKKCDYVDEDGTKTLKIEVPEWKNLITDQLDIECGPIIEVHYMTPKDIMKMTEWNEEGRIAAIKQVGKEYMKRIPIYEIRLEAPRSWIKELDGSQIETKDETDFSYQLIYMAGEPTNNDKTYNQGLGTLIPLYWEDDTEKVYKYLARKPKAGRDFGVGVYEEGDEAQVWTNDAVQKQFRAMEYTTKSISQSASKKLKGRNVLTEVDDGQILEHEDGKPITPLNLLPSGGLAQYEQLITQWYTQFEKATSAYAAQRGETPQSGTPFRLQASVLQQSSSVFKDLQQDLGILITEIFEDWIMPYLAKQLNQEHILAHDFTMDELKEIDQNFSHYHANEMAKKMILSGKIVTPDDYDQALQSSADFIKQTKSQRFLQVPKDYYKKFKAKITVNVTGEQRNKAATLESLLNLLKEYQSNPNLSADPVGMQLFMKIVELSGAGISPIQMMGAIQEQAKAQAAQSKGPSGHVGESMNFKDLPPDGQQQMAAQAGINIQPQAAPQVPQTPQAPQVAKSSGPKTKLSLQANPT